MNWERAMKKTSSKAKYPDFSHNNVKTLLGHLTKPGTVNRNSLLLHYVVFFSFFVQAKMFDSFGVMSGDTLGIFSFPADMKTAQYPGKMW